MAEYINIKDVEGLIRYAIEDSWELDYTLERLKEVNPANVIERTKIDDIKAEINKLTIYHTTEQGSELISKKAVYRVFNLIVNGSRDIGE